MTESLNLTVELPYQYIMRISNFYTARPRDTAARLTLTVLLLGILQYKYLTNTVLLSEDVRTFVQVPALSLRKSE